MSNIFLHLDRLYDILNIQYQSLPKMMNANVTFHPNAWCQHFSAAWPQTPVRFPARTLSSRKKQSWGNLQFWCKTSYNRFLSSLSPCTTCSPAHHLPPAPAPCVAPHLPAAPCCCLSRWRTAREQDWRCLAPSSSSRCCRRLTVPLHHTPYPADHLEGTFGKI